jgi:IMP dehydrogenase/GMP reductase
MAPTTQAIRQYEPVAKTFFGQRPLVDEMAFKDDNTLTVPQDPSCASLVGVHPSHLAGHPESAKGTTWREAAEDDLYRSIAAINPRIGSGQLGYIQATIAGYDDASLHDLSVALIEQTLVNPDSNTIEKPLATFVRLLSTGFIKPPKVDLSTLSGLDDGKRLQRACEFVYRRSGLPKLSQAVGLRDILGNENGTAGYYPPLDEQFRDAETDYFSRKHVGLATRFAWNRIGKEALMVRKPLVPANMRCVTDVVSARVAVEQGLCPVISMDYSQSNRKARIEAATEFGNRAFITVRTNEGEVEVACEVLRKGGAICIEMANANMPRMVRVVRELKRDFPHSFIMVGNLGSAEGYMLAAEAGADVVKLGRGPGAGCTTPEETGLSPGQVTLAYECAMAQAYLLTFRGIDVPMCLDGGISKAGHVLLGALLGAESFMMGSYFAALEESPAPWVQTSEGPRRLYFGEASTVASVISALNQDELTEALPNKGQGIAGLILPGRSYAEAVPDISGGVRGGIADVNRTNLGEVVGTEKPLVVRTFGPGTGHETGTRLTSPEIEEVSIPGRFDLGHGGEEVFTATLGIKRSTAEEE